MNSTAVDPYLEALKSYDVIPAATINAWMKNRDHRLQEFNQVLIENLKTYPAVKWLDSTNQILQDQIAHTLRRQPESRESLEKLTFLPAPGLQTGQRIPHYEENDFPGLQIAWRSKEQFCRELAWLLPTKNPNKFVVLVLNFDPCQTVKKIANKSLYQESTTYWTSCIQKHIKIKEGASIHVMYHCCSLHQWVDALGDNKPHLPVPFPIENWMTEASREHNVDLYFDTSLTSFGWYKPNPQTPELKRNLQNHLESKFSKQVLLHPYLYPEQAKPAAYQGEKYEETALKASHEEILAKNYFEELMRWVQETGASDIHIEPKFDPLGGDQCVITLKMYGELVFYKKIPQSITPKFLREALSGSGIPINEGIFVPMDGRMSYVYPDTKKHIEMRISILPTLSKYPSIVLRILDSSKLNQKVSSLGLFESQVAVWEEACNIKHGLMLIAGPTNSGKSSTLYTIIQQIRRNNPRRSIVTVEDPIEFRLPFLSTQVEVNLDKGMNFPKIIRQFMRHDPNTILVGEIRDKETVNAALQAAQTGHQVLSTIHANSAAEILTRIFDLGCDAFVAAESLKLLVAQTLVGTPCPHCMIVSPEHHMAHKLKPEQVIPLNELTKNHLSSKVAPILNEHVERWRKMNPTHPKNGTWVATGKDCQVCRGTGLLGRTLVQEMIPLRAEDKKHIRELEILPIQKAARDRGFFDIPTNAWEMAWLGKIPISEAFKMTASFADD